MFSSAISNTRGGQPGWAIQVEAPETGSMEKQMFGIESVNP